MNQIEISSDGGCSPTNPGNKYGSYEIRLNGELLIQESKFDLGYGTNNEAEFDALLKALGVLISWMDSERHDPRGFEVTVKTDSTIVRNRLSGKNHIHKKKSWVEKSTRMFNRASECLSMLSKFDSFTAVWEPREMNVSRFGH